MRMSLDWVASDSLSGQSENLLPDFNPLLLFIRQHLLGIAECAGQNVADAGAENLEGEHVFPITDCEPDSVLVDGNDARIHLLHKVSG